MRCKCPIVAAVLVLATLGALADYKFQVPENRSTVVVNTDGSITIRYAITFSNEGQPIDIIDVGLPDNNYDLSEVKADLDAVPVTDIRKSEYLASGVEVHLGDRSIPAGSTGTLNLRALARDRVFRETKDPNYASLEFSPTWYGSQYTSGTCHLVCEFVLPEGVGTEEPRYHGAQFTSSRFENNRVIYTWDLPEASPSSQYTFGASFPARVMAKVVEPPPPPGPLEVLIGGIAALVANSIPCLCISFFVGLVAFSIWNARRRRMKYLPPSVGMEGTEVRRGLTVPEVAVLMEEKVDKVMALLLFGMVRKGLLEVASQKPLKLKKLEGKEVFFSYEKEFSKAVEDDGRLNEAEAARVLTDLIKKVQEKMKGFSRKKTLEYYREIMRKAWDQVGTQDYSQAFEWLLLDKEMPQRARERFPSTPMPFPDWWAPIAIGRTFPSPGGGGGGAPPVGAPIPSGPGPVGAAHNIVTSLESFSHNLVSSVPGLATKVTQSTNPVPVSSGGGGRSGGGGCACACACAGCACACAGGGR